MNIRPIAFVLPQFHPIPENDAWWGEGFTEWTNVKKARPLFNNHYQPHIPTTLGYYDLRLPAVREAQAQLAKDHGLYGFCYYHYWFNGKRLLDQPIDDMLRLKKPDMPFMFCWANENWTRRWDGKDADILMKQDYSFEDDKTHIRWLCKHVFKDERYIQVNGCPVFLIYRQDLFPEIIKTLDIWRDIAKNEFGYKDLYLCHVESFNTIINPKDKGFDAAVEFSPHLVIKHKFRPSLTNKILYKLGLRKPNQLDFRDYKKAVKDSIEREQPHFKLYKSVTPNFDNTPRKQSNGVICIGSNPHSYFKWLYALIKQFKPYSQEENFIFINAMNEWAEGNHLEPCKKYGNAYLEATRRAIKKEK
ncbi:glycoside hydrolase family 99-like domain-containing protein [Xanthomarina sp. GH4-25]|uniref:glycoside hydrolase family 99-like domain-containing protein n=1 Tax=Xanthomarina sp. GH4-25 TaxID=3349335 RepID=UPI0038782D6E